MIKGDLLDLAEDGKFDVIVHGCNCFNNMGAGIAKSIATRYPEVAHADKKTTYGSIHKLGTIVPVKVISVDINLIVINAYTQHKYGRDKMHVDYDAIFRAFTEIAIMYPDKRIGYPKIGAGLAGGDWTKIQEIIEVALVGLDHTLVVL